MENPVTSTIESQTTNKQSEFKKIRSHNTNNNSLAAVNTKSPLQVRNNRSATRSSSKKRQMAAFESFIHRNHSSSSHKRGNRHTTPQNLQRSQHSLNKRQQLLDVREVAKEIEIEQQQILANLQRKQMQLNERKERKKSSSSFDISRQSLISQKENNSQNLNIVDEEPPSKNNTESNNTGLLIHHLTQQPPSNKSITLTKNLHQQVIRKSASSGKLHTNNNNKVVNIITPQGLPSGNHSFKRSK